MSDREVVDAFVAHLSAHGQPTLQVDCRPDDQTRDAQDIDAIAGSLAIEHTSIDTLPHQRRDGDWYMQVVGDLDQQIPVPCRLSITLEYGAVQRGQDWEAVRVALKDWISQEASRLPEGRSIVDHSDIPFRLHVLKSSDRHPGVFFRRFEPQDDTLAERVRTALVRKSEKLAKYRPRLTTILLIENSDIALMNDEKMLTAIRRAFPDGAPPGVDQVWYADTSIPGGPAFEDFTPHLGNAKHQ